MIEEAKAVQRWTGVVEAHEGGGFVAVGDYIALVQEVETAHRAMAVYDDAMDRLRAEIERLKQEHQGCACRWDADDKRVTTCVRHQGWLDVIQEWSERAKYAEAKLKQEQAEPEFIKHEVDNATDWSEWVCPNPSKYLIKCCDCGLVHEAQYRVVKYNNNEDFTVVDDVDTQAQFRMRRSEEWTSDDMAHRAGGLSLEQAEPVGRLMSWKGRGTYPAKGYTVARTWEECSKGAYPEDWEEGALIYTAPQGQTALLRQALEALNDWPGAFDKCRAAITAIKNHLGEA